MKGYIFDLDGVIVDTAKFHFLAWSEIAKELDFTLTEELNEQLKGISRVDSLHKILNWAGKQVSEDVFNDLATRKNKHYLTFVEKMTSEDILPGVIDFLKKAKENGFPIALGSASKNAPIILQKTGILSFFDAIVDGNSVTKAKPDPQVFIVAANEINIPYENCVVFEDSEAGIEAAKAAGMVAVGIGSPKNLHKADYIYNDFTQIKKLNF